MSSRSFSLITVMVFAALMRILPHPWNVSPVAGMALFAGAHFRTRRAALAAPLGALILSDLFLGFYTHMWVVYGSFALIVGIGMLVRNRQSLLPVAGAALASSILFFALTNFGTWALDGIYPKTWPGLLACYTAAIPFFQGTLLGDLAYTALFFGAYRLAERAFPALQDAPSF